MAHPNFGEADPRGLGACPQENDQSDYSRLWDFELLPVYGFHSSRGVVLLCNPTLGEADPGGLGACPQKTNHSTVQASRPVILISSVTDCGLSCVVEVWVMGEF
jgi:hypothetical protein